MTKLCVVLLLLVTGCFKVGRAAIRPGSDMALPAKTSIAAALLGCDDGLAPAQAADDKKEKQKQKCLTTRPDTVQPRPLPPAARP